MDKISLITNDIIFEAKASAVPYNYRISYKVSLICIIIGKCCGKRGCSAIKLQVITAAVSNQKAREELLNLINNIFTTETTLIRFDPAVSRALNFALTEELIYRQSNSLYRLKDKGKQLMDLIYKDESIMQVEKNFFSVLSNKLTEDIIGRISNNWRLD